MNTSGSGNESAGILGFIDSFREVTEMKNLLIGLFVVGLCSMGTGIAKAQQGSLDLVLDVVTGAELAEVINTLPDGNYEIDTLSPSTQELVHVVLDNARVMARRAEATGEDNAAGAVDADGRIHVNIWWEQGNYFLDKRVLVYVDRFEDRIDHYTHLYIFTIDPQTGEETPLVSIRMID